MLYSILVASFFALGGERWEVAEVAELAVGWIAVQPEISSEGIYQWRCGQAPIVNGQQSPGDGLSIFMN